MPNNRQPATNTMTMKTAHLSFALTLGALMHFAPSRASTDAPATFPFTNHALERAVMHQVNRHVIFPLQAAEGDMYGVVDVSFAVDVQGRLVVKEARSENQALRDYVVRKLGKVQVGANPSGLWSTTHLRFIFKPERKDL